MTTRSLLLISTCLWILGACKDERVPGTPTSKPTVAGHTESGHVHTQRTDLGEVTIGAHVIHVFQVAKLVPGKEGDFDLDFAAGKSLPTAVRAWLGIESAVGSRKVRFEKETGTRMHGHPEVPNPLPEGSKLWLDIEGVGKAAVAVAL